MYIVFRVILNFVHFLYNLYYFIQQKCTSFMLFVEHCRYKNEVDYKYSLNTEWTINSNKSSVTISKIPRHLAILLGHEDVSILDLVKLISWCIVAEIPYVSFYDHKGNLQKNQIIIRKKLNELEPSIVKSIEWPSPLKISVNGFKNTKSNKIETNNICEKVNQSEATDTIHKCKTRIHFLSYADCKGRIVTVTKSLAKLINSNALQEENITSEFLSEKLNISNGIPEPDLGIIFGKTMCTYGFLPWQSRFTEFFLLPSHHNISLESFVKTLLKFSECQQRYGK